VYSIIADNGEKQSFSGVAPDKEPKYQQALYASSGLAQGDHTLRLINDYALNPADQADKTWFDIDYVAIAGEM
jgi:hypothetical protein